VEFSSYRLVQHAGPVDGVIAEYPNPHELARTAFALVGSGVHMWVEGLPVPPAYPLWTPVGKSKREGLRSWLIDHFAECAPCSLAASAKIGDDPVLLAFLGLNPVPARMQQAMARKAHLVPAPEVTVTRGRPSDPHYPAARAHEWGEFAYLAIEAGGYSDLTAVNPYTGDRCHTFACRTGGTMDGDWIDNPYQCLRNLIDAMERVNFLPRPQSADDPGVLAGGDDPNLADDDPIDRQDEARGDFTPGSDG
jgi:hypothetical protein